MVRGLLLVLLLASLLPAMPAAAQGLPQVCGPIELTVTQPTSVAPGETAALIASVRNGGETDMSVTVSASLAASSGWRLIVADQSGIIQGRSNGRFEFRAEPTGDASTTATVNFLANGDCAASGPLGCPGGVDACRVSENASTVLQLRVAERGFRGFGDFDFSLAYLAGGTAIVGAAILAPLLLKRRKDGLGAQCPEPLKLVEPGAAATFPLQLHNGGKDACTVELQVGKAPAGWSAATATQDVHLAPGETRTALLTVRAPAAAARGATADVTVRVRDRSGTHEPRDVKVRAEVLAK